MILIKRVRRPLVLAALTLIGACADNIPVGVNQQPQLTTTGRLASVNAEDVVAGQIVVRFRPGAPRSEIAQTHRAHKKGDLMLARTEVLEVPVGEEREIAAQLNTNPNVEFAEPDWIMRVGPCETTATCDLPDGSLWAFKWDFYNTGSFVDPVFGGGTILTGKPDADIDWGDLYDYLGANFQGSAVIGILDTAFGRPTPCS